ncbi:MAG TPA: M23 family metallopeptidase [Pseudomonadota bacterium]|nr:M23 family metallopeptidase [Pseudomonadota bacterium]
MSRRRSSTSTTLRILSDLRLLPRLGRHARKRASGSSFRSGLGSKSRRLRSSVPFWRRYRTPVTVGGILAVLAAVNLYVLYYRTNTSVPALIDLANTGRRAALSPRLQGPAGTPPVPARQLRRGRNLPALPDYPRVTEVKLKEHEPLAAVLRSQGIGGVTSDELMATLRPLLDPGGIGPKQTLTFFYDSDEALSAVDYRLTDSMGYHLERVATGSTERFVTHRLELLLERKPQLVSLELTRDGDLAGAVAQAGEHPALASRLAEVFACDQALALDGRAGDRLRVLIEKIRIGSTFYRYGRLLAAEYLPRGRTRPDTGRPTSLRAFLSPQAYASLENAGAAPGAALHYYTESGESLARALCRAPLQLTRPAETTQGVAPTSASKAILHADRTKLAADYAAAAGTPVLAAAAGRVVFRGSRSPGGLTLVLAHAGGIESSYQHLSRFAKNLKQGQSVRLRQVIGYVGQTGLYPAGPLSTQPHLHFTVRVAGKIVDPLRFRPARLPTLPVPQRGDFNEQVADWLERLSQPDPAAEALAENRERLAIP